MIGSSQRQQKSEQSRALTYDDHNSGDDLTDDSTRETVVVLDNVRDGLAHHDDTLTQDDERQQTHPLNNVGALEADNPPDAGDAQTTKCLQDRHDIPRDICVALSL